MYALPTDLDLSGFIGKTLEQVSFSVNTIHMAFEDGFSITLESSFAHKR